MWHYSDSQRLRLAAQPPSALAQSAFDLLLGMRSVAVTLLYLDLASPDHPVAELPGFVEQVTTTSVTIGLAAPLPRLDVRTRFGVEIMAGPGILRFQSTAFRPPEQGDTRLHLTLPRQIESVQRRMFSRVSFTAPVAYTAAEVEAATAPAAGGVGQGVDLSAGGMRFIAQVPLRYGQTVAVNFHTPDGVAFRIPSCKVVRVQSVDHKYTVAVRFIDTEEALENQLVQSIFRMQLRSVPR